MQFRAILGLVFVFLGCGESEFVARDQDAGGVGGQPNADAEIKRVSWSVGGSPTEGQIVGPTAAGADALPQTLESPCGALRATPDTLDQELCIVAGVFTMGSSSANLGSGRADHTPPHLVELSAFVIDAFEVTVSRYRACVAAAKCERPAMDATRGCTYEEAGGPQDLLPVNCVTALQAEQFCAWDGARRLPTEAEWERTARGIDERSFPWGGPFTCDRAVAAANGTCSNQYDGPKPVGSLPAGDSADGAHDMAGNVAEWVGDFAGSYPSGAVTNPTGPVTGVTRILRGGTYSSNALDIQAFARMTASGTAIGAFGMRCARSAAR